MALVDYDPHEQGEFQDGLSLLNGNVPHWWAKDEPDSEVSKLLGVIAWQLDELSATFEQFFLDRILMKSSANGLQRTWETVWGVDNEQLKQTRDVLVPYLLARIAEDGTVSSFEYTLMALVLSRPMNVTTGPVLWFAEGEYENIGGATSATYTVQAGDTGRTLEVVVTATNAKGSGSATSDATLPVGGVEGAGMLGSTVFPADGSGLVLWQWDGDTYPLPAMGLFFARNGSGIAFPWPPDETVDDDVSVEDGSEGITGFPAYPLTFTINGFVVIVEDFPNYRFTVKVKSALEFNRAAFARAVARFRPAHVLPPTILEVP
jgi:hypothetical protein